MLTVRRAEDRGHADHGWLDTRHTFSFADYYDPKHVGFRALRVINEDRVQPAHGFGTHGHKDMEIISYVLAGALEHKDSMGTGSVIVPGDVQRMSAGTGVLHSEFNASKTSPVHFLQIWLLPSENGIVPGYEQRTFPLDDRRGKLRLIASPDGAQGSVTVHADVRLYASTLRANESVRHEVAPGRHVWIHEARGRAKVNGVELSAGDGARSSSAEPVDIVGLDDAEILLFDLG